MPHSTRASSATRLSSLKLPGERDRSASRSSMEKFPDHIEPLDGQSSYKYPSSPTHTGNGYANGPPAVDRFPPRRESAIRGAAWNSSNNGTATTGGRGHGRQKSLSDAFKTIRARNASVSANVHEIGDALKAPVSPKLIVRHPPSPAQPRAKYTPLQFPMLIVPVSCRRYVSYGICQVLLRIHLPNPSSTPSLNPQPLP